MRGKTFPHPSFFAPQFDFGIFIVAQKYGNLIMYRKLSLFFVVALLVLVSGCTQTLPRASPSEATTGSLEISSTPSGSEIYIDGVYKGTTPLVLSDITTGSHMLELRYPGYTSLKKSVEIKAGTTSYVDTSLSPSLFPLPSRQRYRPQSRPQNRLPYQQHQCQKPLPGAGNLKILRGILLFFIC